MRKKVIEPREAYVKAVAKNEMKVALERLGLKLELEAA